MNLKAVPGDFYCILHLQCVLLFNRPVEEEVVDKDRILQQKEAEVRELLQPLFFKRICHAPLPVFCINYCIQNVT